MSHEEPRDPEMSRLERVYAGYRTDERTQERWDPSNPGNQLIDEERWRVAHAALPPDALGGRVLEVGCGTGHVLARLATNGTGRFVGIDILADRLAMAASTFPDLGWLRADGRALPVASRSVDVVVVFTVFSSILDAAVAREVAAEIDRVLVSGGRVLWYDYRVSHPGNRHTRGMPRRTIAALFDAYRMDLRSATVVPQLARRLRSHSTYRTLAAIPALRTHLCGVLTKPS